MHFIRGTLLGLAFACATATAWAQGKVDNIGNAGGIVIGGERLAGGYYTKNTTRIEQQQTVGGTTFTSETETETRATSWAIFGHDAASPTEIPRLALDYFVIDGLSLGGSFMFLRNHVELDGEQRVSGGGMTQTTSLDGGDTTQQTLIFHPRIGYAIAFNEYIGVWPRAGFSYTHIERRTTDSVTTPGGLQQSVEDKTTIVFTNLTLEGLLFVSPFSSFAFVGGPFADIGLGGKSEFESNAPGFPAVPDGENKISAYGFILGIAGYFDTR